jgi:hypothetical protein
MSRVYFANSGSEANEKAFKMVRQIAHKRYGGKKHKILYRDRDYHGSHHRLRCRRAASERNAQYGPFAPGFVEVPHCLEYRAQWETRREYGVRAADAIEEVILREGPDTVGALCLEPVTAGGGVIRPPRATGRGCRRSAESTTSCCISTRWSSARASCRAAVRNGGAAVPPVSAAAIEIATRIVATARIVGADLLAQAGEHLPGQGLLLGRADEQHHHHLVEGGDEGEQRARDHARAGSAASAP